MKKALALTVLAGLGLAACDDAGSTEATGITTLGSFFVNAFQQDRIDEPLSLDGVTLPDFTTIEPFEV